MHHKTSDRLVHDGIEPVDGIRRDGKSLFHK